MLDKPNTAKIDPITFEVVRSSRRLPRRRLVELMERYGADTVQILMIEEIETSERQIRQTLSKLPDGVFRARDYIEHDGHSDILYQVCVTATKKGDSLTLDMTGTSPQAPGFINCTASGMRGAAMTGLLPILAPNIRWNAGVSARFASSHQTAFSATHPGPLRFPPARSRRHGSFKT